MRRDIVVFIDSHYNFFIFWKKADKLHKPANFLAGSWGQLQRNYAGESCWWVYTNWNDHPQVLHAELNKSEQKLVNLFDEELKKPQYFGFGTCKVEEGLFGKLKLKYLWSLFNFQHTAAGISFHSGAFLLVASDYVLQICGDTLPSRHASVWFVERKYRLCALSQMHVSHSQWNL